MSPTYLSGTPLVRTGGLAVGSSPAAARAPRRAAQPPAALFGFGKDPAKEAAKEAEFQEQQRILEARRAGKALEGSRQRRSKVSQYIQVRSRTKWGDVCCLSGRS